MQENSDEACLQHDLFQKVYYMYICVCVGKILKYAIHCGRRHKFFAFEWVAIHFVLGTHASLFHVL